MQKLLRNPVLIPVAIVIGCGFGVLVCKIQHVSPPKRDIVAAAVATSIAAAIGFLPVWMLRDSSQATLANASLGGTLVHTLLTVVMGFAWWSVGSPANVNAFWTMLLPLYWLSLAALATVSIMRVRTAGVKPQRAVAPVTAPTAPKTATVVAPRPAVAPIPAARPPAAVPPRPAAPKVTPVQPPPARKPPTQQPPPPPRPKT